MRSYGPNRRLGLALTAVFVFASATLLASGGGGSAFGRPLFGIGGLLGLLGAAMTARYSLASAVVTMDRTGITWLPALTTPWQGVQRAGWDELISIRLVERLGWTVVDVRLRDQRMVTLHPLYLRGEDGSRPTAEHLERELVAAIRGNSSDV